jgi:predicted AlkP superfamily phosphohydrolase/phosphomutase
MVDNEYLALRKRPSAEERNALHAVLVRRSKLLNQNGGWPEKIQRRFVQGVLQTLPVSVTGPLWQKLETSQALAEQFIHYTKELEHSRSKFFHGSTYSGNLYLNLVGRDPEGFVSQDAGATLQAELAEKLGQLTDLAGRPLFSGVHTAQSLFHGPAAGYAPDLVLDGYDSPWNAKITNPGLVNGSVEKRYFLAEHGDAGWHSRDGIFVFSGPAFRRGKASWVGEVLDLPATLLYLYDVPIPDDYDGQVLEEAFTADFRDPQPIRFQAGDPETTLPFEIGYDEAEAAEVLEHLRDLGYVD